MKTSPARSAVALLTAAAGLAALATPAAATDTNPRVMFPRDGSRIYVSNTTATSGTAAFEYTIDDLHTALLAGDWDGDGKDTLAYLNFNTLSGKNSHTTGPADFSYALGSSSDETVAGDFNNDGRTDLAIRRDNVFHLIDYVPEGGDVTRQLTYGKAGDEVLLGDWDGNGTDTLAVRRGNQIFIKDTLTTGVADRVITYGRAGDTLLVGDWDGDKTDTFIVRRPLFGPAPADPAHEQFIRSYTGPITTAGFGNYTTIHVIRDGQEVILGFVLDDTFNTTPGYYENKANWPADWYTTDYNDERNWPNDLFG